MFFFRFFQILPTSSLLCIETPAHTYHKLFFLCLIYVKRSPHLCARMKKIYLDLFLIWALRSFDTNGLVFPNIQQLSRPIKSVMAII